MTASKHLRRSKSFISFSYHIIFFGFGFVSARPTDQMSCITSKNTRYKWRNILDG